jgi:four helix bundle protein
MRDFEKLKVWEKSHQWVLRIYHVTSYFPSHERFTLVTQLRRSAVSIPANIAEGCGTESSKELCRVLRIAAASASESEYQLLLARDLGYLKEETYLDLNAKINEVKNMLNSLIITLKPNS